MGEGGRISGRIFLAIFVGASVCPSRSERKFKITWYRTTFAREAKDSLNHTGTQFWVLATEIQTGIQSRRPG